MPFVIIARWLKTKRSRYLSDQSLATCFMFPFLTYKGNNAMITYNDEKYNTISQETYNDFLYGLQIHQVKCTTCGHYGCLRVHGYYSRKVKTRGGSFLLVVTRLVCLECGRTHALLPSSIIPYSQPDIECQVLAVSLYENGADASSVCEDFPDVDENNIKSIIRRYRKHWKQKLFSESIPIFPVLTLISGCFAHFSRQFLQIRRTPNSLFAITT